MNYRHVYHAGNFADVLKHLILTRVICYLKRKPGPFRVIDTHAGAGIYDLSSSEAQKTGEWRHGIGRLLTVRAELPEDVALTMAPYLDIVRRMNQEAADRPGCGGGRGDADADLLRYPGSPVIAAHLLRGDDILIANELHPVDRTALERSLAGFRNAKVMGLDGYVALKATLPPKERRGVILIDPPFEEPGELGRLFDALREGVKRFATGTFLIWYPIKDPRPVGAFKRELAGLGLPKLMSVEFFRRHPKDVSVLNGHGLVMLNAPFTLQDDLNRVLPHLVQILGEGEQGSFDILPL